MVTQYIHYGFNNHTDCSDIKPLEYFWPLAIFGLTPLYKILPHSITIWGTDFIFFTRQVEVFVHMLFKFALLSQTDWENIA